MGVSADWRTTANELFAAFGDAIKDAVVTREVTTTTFDENTGTYSFSTQQISTKVALGKNYDQLRGYNFRSEQPDLYEEGDFMGMLRGSDFYGVWTPKPNDKLTITYEDATTETFRLKRLWPDEAGTMAVINFLAGN